MREPKWLRTRSFKFSKLNLSCLGWMRTNASTTSRLMDIVSQSHQLGDPYSDRRIKQKIMRSFPERFESKVTALEENDGYKDMKPSEVIGRLLAYESRKATTSPPRKKKNIALKTLKHDNKEDD